MSIELICGGLLWPMVYLNHAVRTRAGQHRGGGIERDGRGLVCVVGQMPDDFPIGPLQKNHSAAYTRRPAAHGQRACVRAKRERADFRKFTDEGGFSLAFLNGVSADFTMSAHQELVPVRTERECGGRHAGIHPEEKRLRQQQKATGQKESPHKIERASKWKTVLKA